MIVTHFGLNVLFPLEGWGLEDNVHLTIDILESPSIDPSKAIVDCDGTPKNIFFYVYLSQKQQVIKECSLFQEHNVQDTAG